MTTKIVTILIIGAVLAGSAAASLQVTDASVDSAPVSARTEAGSSGGALVVAVVPPAGKFAASAGGFTQGARWIVVLTPRPSLAAD